MKYTVNYIPSGTKARPGTKLTNGKAQGVVIHNTGNSSKGSGAQNHQKYLYNNRNATSSGFHNVVDDKEAIALIPNNEITYQCGSSKGNKITTSIEICQNSDGDLKKATDNGAMLAAAILRSLGYSTAVDGKNIWQHNYWSSYGKDCPQMIRAGKPYNWNTFINKVNEYMKQGVSLPSENGEIKAGNTEATSAPSKPTTSTSSSSTKFTVPYIANITTSSLNVRSAASMSGKVITTLKKGERVTITRENGGWGYIDDIGGWIVVNNSSYLNKTQLPFNVHSNVNTVNIRNAPSTKAKILYQLKDKNRVYPVTVVRERGKWYGFVNSEYGWAEYFTPIK